MTSRAAREPLHRFKASLFKALGNPLRLRVLELLRHGEMSVRDLLRELEVEPSTASQQLGVLRQQGVVESRRGAGTVYYRLTEPLVGDLLDVGRRIFARQVHDLQGLLAADARAARTRKGRRTRVSRRGASRA